MLKRLEADMINGCQNAKKKIKMHKNFFQILKTEIIIFR